MASLEGDNLVVFYYLSVSENWPDKRDGLSGGVNSVVFYLIRGVASLEGDNLVVFYYLSVSEIWPDKRDGLSGGGQSSGILLSQCI